MRLDARHVNAAPKVRMYRTDRKDAVRPAHIIRAGSFRNVGIRSRIACESRARLAGREILVRSRAVKIENEIRGRLRTFGIVFGPVAGSLARRVETILARDLAACP